MDTKLKLSRKAKQEHFTRHKDMKKLDPFRDEHFKLHLDYVVMNSYYGLKIVIKGFFLYFEEQRHH